MTGIEVLMLLGAIILFTVPIYIITNKEAK